MEHRPMRVRRDPALRRPRRARVARRRPARDAADKIRVVATITDLKALTEAVGGDLVEVDALARGNQNPHDLEVRPSLMVKVRRADLLVINGLEGDQWVEAVVQGANNPQVGPAAPGRVDASEGILVLEVPKTRVDRSMGDVHPMGNPHYTLDPGMAPAVTANILNGPRPRRAPASRRVRGEPAAFLARLEQALARWTATLGPLKGARVVVDHGMWTYFLARFGLVPGGDASRSAQAFPPRPPMSPSSSSSSRTSGSRPSSPCPGATGSSPRGSARRAAPRRCSHGPGGGRA